MKLNHLNLPVTNVVSATHFFETYFNFKCIAVKGENIIAVLKGADGFILVLMQASKNGIAAYPDAFHIGFMLDNVDQVNEIYSKLKSDGVTLEREPKKIRDSFGFYFNFDTIMIEIAHQN